MTGGAELKSPGVGQLQAKKIFLWLIETPSAADGKKFDLEPHGLSASEDVRFGSSQLSGKVDQLEVWFEEVAGGSGISGRRSGFSRRVHAASRKGWAVHRPLDRPTSARSRCSPAVQRLPPTAQQHFEVTGRRLRARVLWGTPQPALSDLTIEDNVQLLKRRPLSRASSRC